jgi:hypothetical protein
LALKKIKHNDNNENGLEFEYRTINK